MSLCLYAAMERQKPSWKKPQNNNYFSIETDLFSFWIYLSNILLRCYLSLLSCVRTVVQVTLTLPSNKALLLNTGLCLDLRWWGSHPREPCRIQEKCSTHGSVARRLRSGVARLFSHPFWFFFHWSQIQLLEVWQEDSGFTDTSCG